MAGNWKNDDQPQFWELFHERSKLTRFRVSNSTGIPDDSSVVHQYLSGKRYYGAFKIPLEPIPFLKKGKSKQKPSITQVSFILASISDQSRKEDFSLNGRRFKSSSRVSLAAKGFPSLEVYVIAFSIGKIPPGVYHYDPYRHELALIKKWTSLENWVEAFVSPEICGDAAAAIFISGVFKPEDKLQGERRYRQILMDAGFLACRLVSAARESGLQAVGWDDFKDDSLNRLFGLDGLNESILTTILLKN